MALGGGGASAGAIRAGAAFVELFVKNNLLGGLDKALAGAKRTLVSGAKMLQGAGAKAMGLATAGFGGIFAVFEGNRGTSKLAEVAGALGLTADAASRLFGVMEASGSDVRDATEGLLTFSGRIKDALSGTGEEAKKLFEEMGFSAQEFQGLSVDKQFYKLVESLRQVQDPASRAALLLKAVGEDTGKNLLPILDMTAEELHALGAEFAMSEDDMKRAKKANLDYTIALARFNAAWRAVATAVAEAVGPSFRDLASWVKDTAKDVGNWIRNYSGIISLAFKIATALAVLGPAFIALGIALSTTATMIGAAGAAVSGFISVLTLATSIITTTATLITSLGSIIAVVFSPLGAVIAGVVLAMIPLVALAADLWPAFQKAFGDAAESFGPGLMRLGQDFQAMWLGITSALKEGDLATVGKIAWLGLKIAWLEGTTALDAAWQKFLVSFTVGTNKKLFEIAGAFFDFGGSILKQFTSIAETIEVVFVGVADSIGNAIGEGLIAISKMAKAAADVVPSLSPLKKLLQVGSIRAEKAGNRLLDESGNRLAAGIDRAQARKRQKDGEIDDLTNAFKNAIKGVFPNMWDEATLNDLFEKLDRQAQAGSEAELNKMRVELEKLTRQAPLEEGPMPRVVEELPMPRLVEDIVKRANYAAGTFSGRDAGRSLSFGDGTFKSIAKNTEKTAEEVAAMRKAIEKWDVNGRFD